MAKEFMGKGPGPAGAPRGYMAGPGGGKAGIKAVAPSQSLNKRYGVQGPDQAIPDKAANSTVKGMSVYSNTKKIKG